VDPEIIGIQKIVLKITQAQYIAQLACTLSRLNYCYLIHHLLQNRRNKKSQTGTLKMCHAKVTLLKTLPTVNERKLLQLPPSVSSPVFYG